MAGVFDAFGALLETNKCGANPFPLPERKDGTFRFIPSGKYYACGLLAVLEAVYKESKSYNTVKFCDVGSGLGNILSLVTAHRDLVCGYRNLCVDGVEKCSALAGAYWGQALTYTGKDAILFDYSYYDVVYAYHPVAETAGMSALLTKIVNDLKVGAHFVFVCARNCTFTFGGVQAVMPHGEQLIVKTSENSVTIQHISTETKETTR
jgi:hypothetical protein